VSLVRFPAIRRTWRTRQVITLSGVRFSGNVPARRYTVAAARPGQGRRAEDEGFYDFWGTRTGLSGIQYGSVNGPPWVPGALRASAGAIIALGVVQFVAVDAARAADPGLYVDRTMASCSDVGPGTTGVPYCSIAAAMTKLQPGSTVFIGNGNYAETIKPAVSGTASAPVTVTAWPGRNPSIGAGLVNGVLVSSRSYVTISNLLVTGTTGAGISVAGGDHVSVLGSEVAGAGQPVSGKVAPGIRLSGTTAGLVQGNFTHHNSDHGILLTGGTTATVVSGNVSSFNAEGYQRNANGIDVVAPGNTLIGNVTHDNEDSGINIYPGGNNTLAANNVTYNNGDHGIDDLNVTGGRLIGNTVFHNCTSGINVEGTSGNYVVENNVAVDNAVYPAYKGISCSRRAGNIGIWDSAPATTTVDHNLVYLSKPGTMYVFKSSYSSLAAMQAVTGQEQHGVQGDPRFAGADAANFALLGGSPAIDRGNSGVSGEQPVDAAGQPRTDDPATPNTQAEGPRLYDDLGAYELQPQSSPSPPTAQLIVSPSSGTAPLPVTVDARGSSDPQGQSLTYAFDFGDGSGSGSQSAATASHTYATAGSYSVTVTVTDTSGLSATAGRTVTVTNPGAVDPTFVGSIANNFSTSTHTSGSVTVWKPAGVHAGDLVVLTLQLSGTSATGAVSGTDSAGNAYSAVGDVTDGSGNRLVVLSGVAAKALAPNDKLMVSFPSALTYRLSADEFAGVVRVDQVSTAAGTGNTFTAGPVSATTNHELAFAAVALANGTANPTWSTGWSGAGTYSTSGRYLSKAYQVVPSSGSSTASGGATGSWLATALTFRS
jgi:parallel beta-helix repeat protein